MDNIEQKTDENEEISLIDLFSVLLKYRKFIVIGSILLIFITSIVYISYVKYKDKVLNYYDIELTIPISNKIKYLNNVVNYDLLNDTVVRFKDLGYIAKLNEKYNVFYYDFNKSNFNQLDYNEFINTKVNSGFYQVKLNSTKSSLIINLRSYSVDNAKKFISEYIQKLNSEYRNYFSIEIENRILLLQEIIDNNNANKEIFAEKHELENLNKDTVTLFIDDFSIFITKNNDILLKFIIIIFASFFIFIFIAFLLNAIQNIKSDKEASTKIKNAWEKGKKLFP
ncbi:MAG: hypothetical protein IJ361_06370 [Spirochaetaceae bacterium]|nr:hypothetical protein [Spirochaetaceae bacterium]